MEDSGIESMLLESPEAGSSLIVSISTTPLSELEIFPVSPEPER